MDVNRLGELTIGVATSAYQIEGAVDRDGRGASIWDTFTARPGTIKNGDTGEHAAAHYDKVDQDVELLASTVADALGDRVPLWATLNEPWVSAFVGHHTGVHAPGIRDDQAAVDAAHHLLLGHGLAIQALRTEATGKLGVVLNPTVVRPTTDRPEDVEAAWLADGVRNRWWLDSILRGTYPDDVLHAFAAVAHISSVRPNDLATIATPIDWLGANYYTPEAAAAGGSGGQPTGPGLDHVRHPALEGERTSMDWVIRPEALTELLVRIHRDYGPIDLWVTENGAAYHDRTAADGGVRDEARVRYLDRHLTAALDARDKGVPLAGYVVWSFLDKFECAEGYEQRFGLFSVDYETQRRVPKDSAHWLRDLLIQRGPRRRS